MAVSLILAEQIIHYSAAWFFSCKIWIIEGIG